jgi:lysophospholipase L1-like esterase
MTPEHLNVVQIAAIGDSLTTGFSVSSPLDMVWRARRRSYGNWFVDRSGEIESLVSRIQRTRVVCQRHYASVGARIAERGQRTFADRLLGTRHFVDQVSQIVNLSSFPNIVLIWIGHNDLDWVTHSRHHSISFDEIAKAVLDTFGAELRRVVEAAARARHGVAIVVFALINFEAFFAARVKAEHIAVTAPERYRRLRDGYSYFPSLKPEHRNGMIELSLLLNDGFRLRVADVNHSRCPTHVSVHFSTALHDIDIASESTLSHIDAWHPSRLGHQLLAAGAFDCVERLIRELSEERIDDGRSSQKSP